jgi:murein DD-endopeptidase MepM/ murein hydrolase activator NlpD
LSANNLTARSYIRPGQKLAILPVDGVVHTVARGDTLSKIARTYAANSDTIVEFNELEEGSTLKVGDQLIVPGGVKPQPKPIVANTPAIVGRPDAIDKVTAPPPSVDAPAGVGYVWPTAATIITQYFGLRHTGVDIAGKQGLAIYATKAGTVITSQCGWNGGYGCYIKIDHGGGVVSWYGHASKMFVEVGDVVTQGQTIALVGTTGNSTGPHLHFEIRVNNKYQNPLSYVRK